MALPVWTAATAYLVGARVTPVAPNQTVQVSLGGTPGTPLVAGGTTAAFAKTTAADGTISFTLGGTPVTIAGGSLAGKAQALVKLADTRSQLDVVANSVITAVNTAQAAGAALDGSAGQPMFSGTGAGNMTMVMTSGADLATAPAGAGANSRNSGNLDALRAAFAAADPAGKMDSAIFDISSAVAGRTVSRDALNVIASNAKIALSSQAGVDMDQEAVNLVRFQQAFQASGRIMQVASDIFTTLINIR